MARVATRRQANIPDPKRDEVTSAEFAVDTEIEQCEFSLAIGQLQPDSDRPYLLQFEGSLLTNDLALVPGAVTQAGSAAMTRSLQVWNVILVA